MKNKEKYAKEIVEIACDGSDFAVEEKTGNVVYCDSITCSDCLFAKTFEAPNECITERRKWAESEYIEKPVISKKDRAFLEYLGENMKWMTRDYSGKIWAWVSIPEKSVISKVWMCAAGNCLNAFNIDFPMVKWEDDEPWLIENLKKLEVVEEYE